MLGDETPFLTKIGPCLPFMFPWNKVPKVFIIYVGPNGENSMASFLP
jgi:hypothetical protein